MARRWNNYSKLLKIPYCSCLEACILRHIKLAEWMLARISTVPILRAVQHSHWMWVSTHRIPEELYAFKTQCNTYKMCLLAWICYPPCLHCYDCFHERFSWGDSCISSTSMFFSWCIIDSLLGWIRLSSHLRFWSFLVQVVLFLADLQSDGLQCQCQHRQAKKCFCDSSKNIQVWSWIGATRQFLFRC